MSGFRTFAILLSVCSALALRVNAGPQYPPVPFQPNLAALFFKSQVTTNPQQAMLCFAQYTQNSTKINEKYSADYKQCLIDTKVRRDGLDQEMLQKSTELVTSTAVLCHRLNACNDFEVALDQFQCHSNVGSMNSKDVYEMSANASDYFTTYQEKYRLLSSYQEQCLKAAERSYTSATHSMYNELQECLDGKVVPITTTPKPVVAVNVVQANVVDVVPTEGVLPLVEEETKHKLFTAPLAKFVNKLK